MTDDPHDRCRFANDARLERWPNLDRLTWPCGLRVDLLGPARKARYFLPELRDLHDTARRVRRDETRRKSRVAKRSNKNHRRVPNDTARETDENPQPRNTVTGP